MHVVQLLKPIRNYLEPMNFIKKIKKYLLLSLAVAAPGISCAQDLLADAAPMDRKLRSLDSMAIVSLAQHEQSFQLPGEELYPTWNNQYTRNYGVAIPTNYRIDLRGFHMPCDSRLVTSPFGYRKRFRRQHYGTDIKVYVGDTIRAAFSGKVRIVAYERKGYGYYVMIRHNNGLETLYGHLSKQLVREDQVVKAGDVIGLGGNTGRSFGSHLHFETRFLGQFINPEKLIDFANQDVLGDVFVYQSNGNGRLMAAADNVMGGEAEMSEEEAALLAKEEESRQFQQQRMQDIQKSRSKVHKVKSGESLYAIARKYGTTVDKLCRLNNINKNSKLRLGQIIKCG